jgi:hypothetical protein
LTQDDKQVLLKLFIVFSKKKKERENNVYMAKLAEQAERYDGKFLVVKIKMKSY